MSTTLSKHEDFLKPLILGNHISEIMFDHILSTPMSYKFSDYKMVRVGPKHYGFRAKTNYGFVKQYYCSHLSATRQFIAYLVAARLLN